MDDSDKTAATDSWPSSFAPRELVERLVLPYYFALMRAEALNHRDLMVEVAMRGREASRGEIIALLEGEWRSRTVGAWMAAAHDDADVIQAVLDSLSTAEGSLCAPALTAVATVKAGPKAIPSLCTYFERDLEHGWGAAGYAAAATEFLSIRHALENPLPTTTARSREFMELASMAQELADDAAESREDG